MSKTDEIIAKMKEVHSDCKYDYSKVEYTNSQTKVIIICREHGEFLQTPKSHLRGQGCSSCSDCKKYTTETWIKKAIEIHGDKYDYSKVDYKNSNIKVTIICKTHGEFKTKTHTKGVKSGCPKCVGRNITSKMFIENAIKIHGDKYDYSLVQYTKSRTNIIIICKIHGKFEQSPTSHLQGNGCKQCFYINKKPNYKYTTESFIEKVIGIHGDKYDYSKVDYQGTDTKIIIICKKHDEFLQTPTSHLQGSGCRKCANELKKLGTYYDNTLRVKYTIETLLQKFLSIHGDKYDYSKVDYVNNNTKIIIICKMHGEFLQKPSCHIIGQGCSKCGHLHEVKIRSNTQSFIEKATEIHGDKYHYSKVDYKGHRTEVIIICKIHGEFLQKPAYHLSGHGCSTCGIKYQDTQSFIEKAIKKHNEKYDYSKVIYIDYKTEITIICKEHGEFNIIPVSHLAGNGCRFCSGNIIYTTESIIEKFIKIHNNKYDYSKVNFQGTEIKTIIICEKHDEFLQTPKCHLKGHGCPSCNESKGEKLISGILTKYSVKFERQKRIEDCKYILPLPFDFYLSDYNAFIEYDGEQHFEIVEHFGEESFENTQRNDKIKNEYCFKNLFPLMRIKYTDTEIERKICKWLDLDLY